MTSVPDTATRNTTRSQLPYLREEGVLLREGPVDDENRRFCSHDHARHLPLSKGHNNRRGISSTVANKERGNQKTIRKQEGWGAARGTE